MFGELLAGLMESGQLMSDPNVAQFSACLFPSSDQPVAQDGAPAGQSSGNQSLIDQEAAQGLTAQPFVLFGGTNASLPAVRRRTRASKTPWSMRASPAI